VKAVDRAALYGVSRRSLFDHLAVLDIVDAFYFVNRVAVVKRAL
jgi:hypothetical protein